MRANLPAVSVCAFDNASFCRLPATTIYLQVVLHIIQMEGRTGPELGRLDLDRRFRVGVALFAGLVSLVRASSSPRSFSRSIRLAILSISRLSMNLR